MEKRLLRKVDHKFLQTELEYSREQGIISPGQETRILELYGIKNDFSFIKVIITIGSILIGLGILSFIASNWDGLTKTVKFVIILSTYFGVNLGGYALNQISPKTSRGLFYLGSIIYGAGIFLVGQMFNFGGHFSQAFLLWSVGVIPMALVLKDNLLYMFSAILLIVYMNGQSWIDTFPYFIVLLVPAYYYFARYLEYRVPVLFINNVLVINMLGVVLNELGVHNGIIGLVLFAVGIAMYLLPSSKFHRLFQIQGTLLLGASGIFLTLPYPWEFLHNAVTNFNYPAIAFALVYLAILFFFTRQGNLISLVFICLTIFRFYTDTMYAFSSKSLFFIIGGVILLGFGFYFEKLRKQQGGVING